MRSFTLNPDKCKTGKIHKTAQSPKQKPGVLVDEAVQSGAQRYCQSTEQNPLPKPLVVKWPTIMHK